MSHESLTTLIETTADNITHESALIDTTVWPSVDKDLRPQYVKRELISEAAQFTLSVLTLTTSGIGVIASIVAEIDGVDHEIGTFTITTIPVVETIVVPFCPDIIKLVSTATDTTVYTASVHCTRL